MPNKLYPVDVYMFRHGEGKHQLDPSTASGRSNHFELTEKGEKESRQLGRLLRAAKIFPTRAYASPAVRAKETGRLAMDTMGLSAMQIIVDNALQELGHGPWEGRPYNELYTDEALARMRLLGKDFKFEGGESMNDAAARGFDWLEREAPYETEIPEQYFAFTHGTLMKTMVGHILGWERQVIYEKKINNTGAVLLRGRGRDWNIIYDGVDPTDLRLPSLL